MNTPRKYQRIPKKRRGKSRFGVEAKESKRKKTGEKVVYATGGYLRTGRP